MSGFPHDARDPLDVLLVHHAPAEVPRFVESLPVRLRATSSQAVAAQFARPGARYQRPQLIVLDLDGSRIAALEALRFLKASPILRSVPVIVLAGSRAPDDVAAAYAQGAASYLAKPAGVEEYERLLRRLFDYWGTVEPLPRANPSAEIEETGRGARRGA